MPAVFVTRPDYAGGANFDKQPTVQKRAAYQNGLQAVCKQADRMSANTAANLATTTPRRYCGLPATRAQCFTMSACTARALTDPQPGLLRLHWILSESAPVVSVAQPKGYASAQYEIAASRTNLALRATRARTGLAVCEHEGRYARICSVSRYFTEALSLAESASVK